MPGYQKGPETSEKQGRGGRETTASDEGGGEPRVLVKFLPEQHFTTGPARYTDASIVKTLEELGIGRPSTYAPIISVLLDRYYVVRKNKQLQPTTLGRIISEILIDSFPDIVEVNFTADMEKRLDGVEENKEEWHSMIREFYGPFKHRVDHVMDTLESIKGVLDEPTDFKCEKCGRPMVKKLGRYGFFLACSGFPGVHEHEVDSPRRLPAPRVRRSNRRKAKAGRTGQGVLRLHELSYLRFHHSLQADLARSCPKCGWFLVEKTDKKRGSFKACINPACDFLHSRRGWEEDSGD